MVYAVSPKSKYNGWNIPMRIHTGAKPPQHRSWRHIWVEDLRQDTQDFRKLRERYGHARASTYGCKRRDHAPTQADRSD